jgi:hypothetical protein
MYAALRRSGGIEALSRHLAMTPVEAGAAVLALLPIVLGGFHRRFGRRGGGVAGVVAVAEMLAQHGGGQLAMKVLLPEPIEFGLAEAVTAQALPDATMTATELDAVAARSGLDRDRLAEMLPVLTMLTGGYLSARIEDAKASGANVVGEFEHLCTIEWVGEPSGADQADESQGPA